MFSAIDPGAASVIVAAIGGVVAVALERMRREVKAARKDVAKVETSVHGVPEGTPPLVLRVTALEERQSATDDRQDASDRWITDALTAIGGQLGVEMPNRKWYH